jgi:tetratricopeptide (TPR) repeat protein
MPNDSDDAPIQLAHLLSQGGDEQQAEAVLRDAAEAGNPVASLSLGVMLHKRGERQAAKVAFRRADEDRPAEAQGWVDLLPYVRLLAGEKRAGRREAEAALRWAQKGGFALAGTALAHLHDQRGNRQGGLDEFRRTAEGGDFVAAMKWGGMAEAQGNKSEAEEAFRLAKKIAEGRGQSG